MHPLLSKKQVNSPPPSKWVKTNGFNALLQWLLGFLSFLLHTSLIFSHINTPLLISVNIYLCKLLIFVCCNISGIESFLNQRFCNSIKPSSTQIKRVLWNKNKNRKWRYLSKSRTRQHWFKLQTNNFPFLNLELLI